IARGCELVLDLRKPHRMHAIPGADDRDALAGRPPGEILKVEVAAGGARIFGMNMQVGMKFHGVHRPLMKSARVNKAESFGRIPRLEQGTVWTSSKARPSVPHRRQPP